jgi:multimeric flavodoxin WrbA
MPNYTFLLASARNNGNSEQLARLAAETLPNESKQTWLTLRDHPLPAFQDLRHDQDGYAPPTGDELKLFDATAECDQLVFVTPVYWYSVPAPLKLYLDYWSAWMRVENLDFRNRMTGKQLWAISASAGAANEAQHMFDSLKLCATYMKMDWGGHVLGNGTAAGDVIKDEAAVSAARELFKNEV